MADFETTTDPADCRVWSWGLVGIGDDWRALALSDVELGTTLDDFIERISLQNSICYFHNLKFDGRFILDSLLKAGYLHAPNAGRGPMEKGAIRTLISELGQFYTITVRWRNGFNTEFRDSAKKLPMKVSEIAEAFHMEVSKGEIDYDKPRPVGYIPTEAEWDYVRRDILIPARALGQQLSEGMGKLTVGSDALFEFTKILGRDNFERLFPVFSESMDAEIRRAYRGGFTYADPRFSGRLQGAGAVYDVNSLYPSVMYYKPIPYGEPEFVDGYVEPTKLRPLTIFSITFTAKLKRGHIPCIQIKGSFQFSGTEYLTEVTEPTTLMVTNIDFDLMNDHYDLNVMHWGGGWRFHSANGIFEEYIDKWSAIKRNNSGGLKALAKLQLNSLYGKFATNPNVTGKVPSIENNTVVLRAGDAEQRSPVYTAAGVFITSYARDITIRAAQANFDVFAYADTDSLHLLSTRAPNGITVHSSELGAWKQEYEFNAAYYIRAKAYMERELWEGSERYHNAIAGIPTEMSSVLTFDDLKPGTEIFIRNHGRDIERRMGGTESGVLIHGKLNPRAVPGGIVLTDVPYELKL